MINLGICFVSQEDAVTDMVVIGFNEGASIAGRSMILSSASIGIKLLISPTLNDGFLCYLR